jgi:hypothetical protein
MGVGCRATGTVNEGADELEASVAVSDVVDDTLVLWVFSVLVDASVSVLVLDSRLSPVLDASDVDDDDGDLEVDDVVPESCVEVEEPVESLDAESDRDDDGMREENDGSGGDPVIMGIYSIHAGMAIPIAL